MQKFNPDQLDRYEMYRRSGFGKNSIKKVMQGITGSNVGQKTAIVMAGISKIYAGELIETARTVMDEWDETTGAIRPRHLREAYRRLKHKNKVPQAKAGTPSKRLFHK